MVTQHRYDNRISQHQQPNQLMRWVQVCWRWKQQRKRTLCTGGRQVTLPCISWKPRSTNERSEEKAVNYGIADVAHLD